MVGVLKPIDLFERWLTSLAVFNQTQWTAMHRSSSFFSQLGHFLLLGLNLFVPVFLIGIYGWYLIYSIIGFPLVFFGDHLFKHIEGFLQGLMFAALFLIALALLIYIIIPVAIWIIQVVWWILQFLWDTLVFTLFSVIYFFQWIVYIFNILIYITAIWIMIAAIVFFVIKFLDFDDYYGDREGNLTFSAIVIFVALISFLLLINLTGLFNGGTFTEYYLFGGAGLYELVWKVISFPPQWLGPLNLYSFMQ